MQKRENRESKGEKQSFTRAAIRTVTVCVVGIVSILALFDLAGPVGNGIIWLYRHAFGAFFPIVPVGLIIVAVVTARTREYKTSQILGLVIFFLSLFGFFHLFIPPEEGIRAISEGRGGGYLGFVFSIPFRKVLGTIGAGVVMLGLAVIAAILVFEARILVALNLLQAPFRFLRTNLSRGRNRTVYGESGDEGSEYDDSFDTDEISEDTVQNGEQKKPLLDAALDRDEAKNLSNTLFSQKKKGAEIVETEEQGHVEAAPRIRRRVDLPIDLLSEKKGKAVAADIDLNKEMIRKTLANFNIEVEMGDVAVGPTIAQFTLRPKEGVKLSRITGLQSDLSLALAAHPIRIEAPIPGKSLVGIEVPNQQVAVVTLKEVLLSDAFKRRKSNLSIALGKDVSGKAWVGDLQKMPHLLVAGATGSGKSMMINSIIVSLLYQNQPDSLRFILVDPKRVEMTPYNGIPHLLTPVITDVTKTINALKWVVGEMDRRFDTLSQSGVRNIEGYNEKFPNSRMHYIVVIIDELADLMSLAAGEVEAAIVRLAQMARAVGIHLIIATQRPSVDIITGLIKANITSRIAFSVASLVDSRTILDASGAEKLLGRGDMLFLTAELSKPRRIQGTFLSDEDVHAVAQHLKNQSDEPEYVEAVVNRQSTPEYGDDGDSDDSMYEDAKRIVVEAQKASASYLQRRLRVGYSRAARLLDLLEQRGVIGPPDGARPREVLIHRGAGMVDEEEYVDPETATDNQESEDTFSPDEISPSSGTGTEEINEDLEEFHKENDERMV